MRINITGKYYTVSDALEARIEKKLNKMSRYFRGDVEAQVRLTQEKNTRFIAEITLYVDGLILRAEETSPDMFMSVDKAVERMDGQIRRHRTKLEKRLRDEELPEPEEAASHAEPEEEMDDELVRVKRFEVKPMSVEDAIAQMGMLGHNFYLFVNAETGITSVVYRRKDGKVGMLEPTMA